jgi:hypothetical protein
MILRDDGRLVKSPYNLSGADNPLWMPDKTVVVHRQGRRSKQTPMIKIRGRWRRLARVVYESAHGPIPTGHVVMHLNGDARDCRVDNLLAVSRGEFLRRMIEAMTPERRAAWHRKRTAHAAAYLAKARQVRRLNIERRRKAGHRATENTEVFI